MPITIEGKAPAEAGAFVLHNEIIRRLDRRFRLWE